MVQSCGCAHSPAEEVIPGKPEEGMPGDVPMGTKGGQMLQRLWLYGQLWPEAVPAGRRGHIGLIVTGQEARPRDGTPGREEQTAPSSRRHC